MSRSVEGGALPGAARENSAQLQPVLEVTGLRKSFGPVEALRGADLQLFPGEVLALVGDNGAGKTTLVKHLAGVYRADAGEIRLAGRPVTLTSPKAARDLGIETVYQDLALADDLAIGANIFLGREPIKRLLGVLPYIDDGTIKRETAALLARIRSHVPAGAQTVARLSGGQRQAVAIARAIYWQAKVVLMDEPTAALAVMEREKVIQHARELASHGAGVIYIGHNLSEILQVADRIVVMLQGRTVHVTRSDATDQQQLIRYMTGFTGSEKAA